MHGHHSHRVQVRRSEIWEGKLWGQHNEKRWGDGAGFTGLLSIHTDWEDPDSEWRGDTTSKSILCQVPSRHLQEKSPSDVPHSQHWKYCNWSRKGPSRTWSPAQCYHPAQPVLHTSRCQINHSRVSRHHDFNYRSSSCCTNTFWTEILWHRLSHWRKIHYLVSYYSYVLSFCLSYEFTWGMAEKIVLKMLRNF